MAFSTLFLDASSGSGTMDGIKDMVSDLSQTIGVDLFEEDIDNVVFQTNEFLCNSDFIGSQGPFWWLLGIVFGLVISLFAWNVINMIRYYNASKEQKRHTAVERVEKALQEQRNSHKAQ